MDTRQILLELYHTLGGQYWKQDTNWNTPTPLSTWHGVVVDDNNALLELNLEENNLEGTLPSCITLCSKLKRLNLRGNKLTGPLPDAIGRCAALKDLGLSRNILTGTIPESLGQCANLEYLGLSNNRLIDNIPESLGRCVKLREVSLGHNKLTGTIPESLGRCTNLATLSLSDNRLSGELPECLEKLSNLQKLLLDNNQFNGPLPNFIGKCVNLRQLSIADNELSGFFPESLGKCVNLKRLNLSGNSISGRIPDSFGSCNQLDHLYLQGNRLVGYEIIRKFHRLKVLDIDLVAILDLPNELQGRELQIILSYIRELYLASTALADQNEDTSTLLMKRVKFILMGPGEAGKTTLLHRLIHGKFEGGYGMTDGINMSELVIDDLKISFWDFSGQNIYMNTHLLFFSSDVMYLVIWNPRQHDHHSFISVYLNMIRNYSPSAPVILVTTHAKDTSKITDYTLSIINNQFSSTGKNPGYGPICCYHHVDSQTGIGIQELKRDILKYSLQQPWVVQRVPKIYKKLEIGLKELGNHGRFSLTKNEYLKYCYEVFKIDDESSLHALQLFHNWGIIHVLSLGDIVIEPQKLALVMSSAISYKAEIIYRMGDGKLGLLRHDEIDLVWKEFDESLRPQFLQMFHDYKLAYPLFDSKGQSLQASIVPAMLPDEPLGGGFSPTEEDLKQLYFPVNCKKQASVRLECDYLPVALIPKLQVRLSLLATLGGAWKYGCALQLDSFHRLSEYTMTQSYAIIQSNPFLHTIDIYSGGETTCARSIAIKCLLELQKECFSTMVFTDVKVYYNSEPIAANKLISRKLKRDLYSYLIYEGDNESVALPLRGLALLFPECYPTRLALHHQLSEDEKKEEEFLRKNKIAIIHEEMINMSKNTPQHSHPTTPKESLPVNPDEQYTIPIVDLLIKKKKLQRQQSSANGKPIKLERPKSSVKRMTSAGGRSKSMAADYVDYRQVYSTKLLTLEQVALQVLANPNTLEELIDLEALFLECFSDILLFGCNVPCDLFDVHTLWIAFDGGKYVIPLTPPEKPTNPWKPVPSCILPVTPRSDRSTLPGINKRVGEIVLLVLSALGIECPPASSPDTLQTKKGGGYLNPQFMTSSTWTGLVDLTPFIDAIKNVEVKSFTSIENCLGKVMWVEKDVASKMHAPNMTVSDQVFRELFKGTRGANPHAALLRDAIDNIIPISLGILPRYDFFISHSSNPLELTVATLIRDYLQSRGYCVWVDVKRKYGLNKGMLTAIDSSSYVLLLLSTEYIQQIATMEAQQYNPITEDTLEYTSFFQFIYALKRKNVKRILPIMLEDDLMRGWDLKVTHDIIVNRYKLNQERERALEEAEYRGEEEGDEEDVEKIVNEDPEEEEELQIEPKEYEAIRLELIREHHQKSGWKGEVGKYLFDYSDSGKPEDQKQQNLPKIFISSKLISDIENDNENKKRKKAEELLQQQMLLEQGKKKKKEKKGLRGMLGSELEMAGGYNAKPPLKTKESFALSEAPRAIDDAPKEGETPAEEDKTNSEEDPPSDENLTNKEKLGKIFLSIQENLLLQQLIQCAFAFATNAPKDSQSSNVVSLLSQLHESHRILRDVIENPLCHHPDLWIDDSLLSDEQKQYLKNEKGENLDHITKEEGNQLNSSPSSPPRTSPQSPSATSSPFPFESIPTSPFISSDPKPAFSLLSSSNDNHPPVSNISVSISSFHPIMPLNSDYHIKYKFLYTLSLPEVMQLFKSLNLTKYLHIISDNEITGMTLQHCQTVNDLRAIGITSEIKCREFLTYLIQMKLSGVPMEFIQENKN